MAILATSRTVLGLRAEREYPVPPLPLPADPATVPVEDLAASPAVALFVDRARAVRPGFALTAGNAAAVAEICRRLEGLPLAIELAAARTRLLDPAALLDRLARSLDALGTGAVDLPERQHTLRATVEWSVGLLDDAERSLLEVAAVFADGWTVEAAAQVAGLEEDRALELTEALARHSLIQLDSTGDGPRCRMLETVRVFVAERLAARPDVAEVQRRHAGYYRALAEQAEPAPARRRPRPSGWSGCRPRRATWPPPCAGTWATTPRRCPTCSASCCPSGCWPTTSWARPAPGSASSCPPPAPSTRRPGAELLWAAAVTANQAGDGAAALAARERLGPLLAEIHDPYLRAVSQLAMAWTSTIAGDFDGAIRQASVALEELRGQDEPYWTAVAVAHRRLRREGRRPLRRRAAPPERGACLAERFGYAWLATWSRVQLGTLAVVRGRLDEARALLDEALAVSLAAHSTQNVTLCLAAFARLAFARVTPSGRRCWPGRPRACGGEPAWRVVARRCGGERPIWPPRSARRWGPTGSTRYTPPAPGSAAGTRWPPPAISAPPPGRPEP